MRIALWLAVAVGTLVATVQAQEPATSGATFPSTPPIEEAVTAESIESSLKQVDELTGLDDATKLRLKELYAQARQELERAVTQQKRADQFQSSSDSAAADTEAAQEQQESPLETYDFASAEDGDLDELTNDLQKLEGLRDEAKKESEAAAAVPKSRAARKAEIPPELAAARERLAELDAQLKVTKSAEPSPLVTQANRTLVLARRQAELATIASLEAERNAYDAQAKLLPLRTDLATRRVNQLDADFTRLSDLVASLRRKDASAQWKDATSAWEAAPPALKPFREKNLQLAKRRLELVDDIKKAAADRDRIVSQLESWRDEYQRNALRADKDTTGTIGLLLVKRRVAMPSLRVLRQAIAARRDTIRQTQSELFESEDDRYDLADVKAEADNTLQQLRGAREELPADAETRVIDIYAAKKQILDNLIADTNRYYSILIGTSESQESLSKELRQYADFIEKQAFWIRTFSLPQVDDLDKAQAALGWLADPSSWQSAVVTLWTNAAHHFDGGALAVCALLLLLVVVFRRPAKRKIRDLGAIAAPASCRQLRPTLLTLGLTLWVALPVPLLVAYLGWRLGSASDALVRALSVALTAGALPLFSSLFVVHLCRPQGLADAHFGWSRHALLVLRRNTILLVMLGGPVYVVMKTINAQDDLDYISSLGRLCLVMLTVLMTVLSHRVFRFNKGALHDILAENPTGRLNYWRHVWYLAALLTPIALGVLAIVGFSYTAWTLLERVFDSVMLAIGLAVVDAMLSRWVRVKRRRIRWQKAIEARGRAAAAAEDSETSPTAERVVEEPEIDLVGIDFQTRRLIHASVLLAGLVGMWLIWSDVLSALSILEEQTLWKVVGEGGDIEWVTLADVLFAALVTCLTVTAARNAPGLIEIVLLERLQVEASIRYAISALSQYAIVAVGFAAVAGSVGFSWNKVQWLVAALGVGVGFGLQEIVANFICGIILLFERPIRVGDVVTLGDMTGVVTKIRIRATTVRNWDRQELLVPNRELITGRIVNWTLSDEINRIVIKVGVAYGSDVRRVRELLFEILNEHSKVLDDPGPTVTFEQFGDSTLDFSIRACLAQLGDRLDTIHDLHAAIHQRFGEQGIEIAFPQRDLHIRTIQEPVPVAEQKSSSGTGMSP